MSSTIPAFPPRSLIRVRASRRSVSLMIGSPPDELRDAEGEVEGLARVEPRVADRLVAAFELGAEHLFRAADALGDVVAGELDVHAAGPHVGGAAHCEERLELGHHVVEVAGLVA